MVCDIFYGEISDARKENWNLKTNNPYEVLVKNKPITKLGGWEFLTCAKEMFRDEIQIDWGSFAYKCDKEELKKLEKQTKCNIPGLNELEEGKDYGIIFIENY